MQVVAFIRNVATGEVREYHDPTERPDDIFARSNFISHWTDGGNYSCDCNRALFFARAAGENELNPQCGEGAFTIVLRDAATGEVLWDDSYSCPSGCCSDPRCDSIQL